MSAEKPVTVTPRKRGAAVKKNVSDLGLSIVRGTAGLSALNLTSLDGITEEWEPDVIIAQNNFLASFEGLPTLKTLKTLHLENNRISSLKGLKFQPHLIDVYLKGNPIVNHPLCGLLCLICFGPSLRRLDGKPFKMEDRRLAQVVPRRIRLALFHGWMPSDGTSEDAVSISYELWLMTRDENDVSSEYEGLASEASITSTWGSPEFLEYRKSWREWEDEIIHSGSAGSGRDTHHLHSQPHSHSYLTPQSQTPTPFSTTGSGYFKGMLSSLVEESVQHDFEMDLSLAIGEESVLGDILQTGSLGSWIDVDDEDDDSVDGDRGAHDRSTRKRMKDEHVSGSHEKKHRIELRECVILLKAHPEHEPTVRSVLHSIQAIENKSKRKSKGKSKGKSKEGSKRSEDAGLEGFDAIIGVFHRFSMTPDIIESALRATTSLVRQKDSGTIPAIEKNLVEELLLVLEQHSSHIGIVKSVMTTFAALCDECSSIGKSRAKTLLKVTLSTMDRYLQDIDVVIPCVRNLIKLVKDADIRQAFGSEEGPRAVMTCLRRHTEESEVVAKGIELIRMFLEMVDIRNEFVKDGVISYVLDGLRVFKSIPNIQAYGLEIIRVLASGVDHRSQIIELQAVRVVLDCMKNQMKNEAVQTHGSIVIANLALETTHSVDIAEASFPHLYECLMTFEENGRIIEAVITALKNLAMQGDNQVMICTPEFMENLCGVLENNVEHAVVCERTCGLVRNLAVQPNNRPILVGSGIFRAIVLAMKTHPNIETLQKAAGNALWNITRGFPEHLAALLNVRNVREIIDAACDYSDKAARLSEDMKQLETGKKNE